MIAPTRPVLAALTLLGLAACAGGDPTLTLLNEQPKKLTGPSGPSTPPADPTAVPNSELDINLVAYRSCAHVKWDPSEPGPDLNTDVPPDGRAPIPFGQSRIFTLAPGCWDFVARRGTRTTSARVILDVGESGTWVPFRIDDNEVWW